MCNEIYLTYVSHFFGNALGEKASRVQLYLVVFLSVSADQATP